MLYTKIASFCVGTHSVHSVLIFAKRGSCACPAPGRPILQHTVSVTAETMNNKIESVLAAQQVRCVSCESFAYIIE